VLGSRNGFQTVRRAISAESTRIMFAYGFPISIMPEDALAVSIPSRAMETSIRWISAVAWLGRPAVGHHRETRSSKRAGEALELGDAEERPSGIA
jgi:hypothetical protein